MEQSDLRQWYNQTACADHRIEMRFRDLVGSFHKRGAMAAPPVTLSSSQVSLILQRAAEIDARGDTLTIEELRRIAGEAGIDPAATSTAIEEVLAGEEGEPPAEPSAPPLAPRKSSLPSPHWIVTGGALGVAIGFIISLEEPARPLAIGGALVYLILRAVRSMKLGAQLDFQLQNFVLWLGVAVGGWASEMFFTEDVFLAAFAAWFVTSVLGGLIVQFGPREEGKTEDTAVSAPAALPDSTHDSARDAADGAAMPPSRIAPPQGG